MAYDILDIEAKRLAAVRALQCLNLATSEPELLAFNDDVMEALAWLRHDGCTCYYCTEVADARKSQQSLSHPNDSPEPSPVWLSEENRSRRFVLKACNLWSDEYKEPTVTSPQTWEQVNLAADFLAKYIANPKYRDALTPDRFTTYYRSTTDSPLRPQYIPERFNDFLSWCRAKGYIA